MLLTTRIPRPPAPLLICIATGAIAATALYPAGAYLSGLLNVWYPAVLMLLVFVAGTVDSTSVRRMLVAGLLLGGCFVALLMLVSTIPISGDPNVTYRSQYSIIFFVQRWGVLPGLAILAVATIICARTVIRDWRPAALGGRQP